jgi:hypothetical protein
MKTDRVLIMVSLMKKAKSVVFLAMMLGTFGALDAAAQSVAPACQPAFIAGMNYQKSYSEQQVNAIQAENQAMKERLAELEQYITALEGDTNTQTADSKSLYPTPIDRRDD